MQSSKSNILLTKLNGFIVKYHKYELYRGLSIFVILLIAFFSGFTLLENFAYFTSVTKTVIISLLGISFLGLLFYLVVYPLLHIIGVLKPLSFERANTIIVQHFPEIKDELLNTLELVHLNDSTVDNSLLIASIEQRTQKLSPFPFSIALRFDIVKKYALYAVSCFSLLIALFFLWPDFTVSSQRLINYSVDYQKPAPFQFVVKSSLDVKKGNSLFIDLSIEGELIPNSVKMVSELGEFYMKRNSSASFKYEFQKVVHDFEFYFQSGEYRSVAYKVNVLPSPRLKDLTIAVLPPSYTGLDKFETSNSATVTIAEGSTVIWKMSSEDVDSLRMIVRDSSISVSRDTDGNFELKKQVYNSLLYSFVTDNQYFTDTSVQNFVIEVEKDMFPRVIVNEKTDSTGLPKLYLQALITDDYGFSKLSFTVKNTGTEESNTVQLSFDKSRNKQLVYHSLDLTPFSGGDSFEYYFTVYDNDAVNGFKSARSESRFYNLPTEEALAELEDSVNTDIKKDLEKSLKQAQDIQKDISKLKERLLNEKMSDWQRDQMISDIQEKHADLKKSLEKIKKQNETKNELFENLSEKDDLKKKQEELQELLSKVMDEELMKLMEELEKLKNEFDKNELFDLTEDMEMSYEDMEKQLDKDIELLKRYDLERKLENTISEMKKLSDSQKDLSEKIKESKKDGLDKEIDKEKEKLSDLKDKYNELMKENEGLEDQFKLDSFEKEFEEISQELNKSSEEKQNGKEKKSSESMQNAGEKSEELSQKMDQMMQDNLQQQSMENIDDLRQILDNLIIFSFDEENLIDEGKQLKYKDPRLPELANKQMKLKENFTVIEDSLYALAKREPMISAQIHKDVLEIQKNMNSAIKGLENNKRSSVYRDQQFVMTSSNNLALLLSEILKQMQQQMAQKMKGQQQCQNPSSQGKGSPSLSQIKSQQQSLKQQLQQMIDQMKSQKPGEGKPGGSKSMSKQLSKTLAEQEMYNEQLNQMMKDGSFSPDAMQQLKEIKKLMDQNEKDIVNRNISQSTMYRQDQIMSRLLEAEKAEREREQDKKRKSESGDQNLVSNPEEYFSDKLKQNDFSDVIDDSLLELNKVYKQIYEEYLIRLSSEN